MKKVFLTLVLALTISVANAWEKHADEGVVVLATKHLTPKAKSVVQSYLGKSYLDDVYYLNTLEQKKLATHSNEIHYLHLDKDLKPMKVDGDDAFAAIENSLAIIRARDSYSKDEVIKALRTVINLMCDIHNFTYVRIEGIPHSQQHFKVTCYEADYGKRKFTSLIKWTRFWLSYTIWHKGTSGDLWAEDIDLCLGSKREELSQGTLQDWVAQIGAKAAELYTRITPEYVMTRRERNELEDLNYEMMARAGYRLAVLLNENLK